MYIRLLFLNKKIFIISIKKTILKNNEIIKKINFFSGWICISIKNITSKRN